MKKIRVKLEGPPGQESASLLFDCPWNGHLADDRMVLRNSNAPNVIGHRCVKCGCLVYSFLEQSQVVGPDGNPLAGA